MDTNVLVYAYDRSEPAKQREALALLRLAHAGRSAVLSSQVLSEFYSVVTRKIAAPLSALEAAERVRSYAGSWPVLPVTGAIVLEATRGVCERGLSFWDAVLWATAKLNQVSLILSEDFADGATVEGVTFVNPFATTFVAERWLR